MAHSSTKRAKGLSLKLGKAERLSILGSVERRSILGSVERLSILGSAVERLSVSYSALHMYIGKVIGHCSKYIRSIDIIWKTASYLTHLFPFIHIVFFHIQWALWIPFPLDPFDYFVRICSLYLLASS